MNMFKKAAAVALLVAVSIGAAHAQKRPSGTTGFDPKQIEKNKNERKVKLPAGFDLPDRERRDHSYIFLTSPDGELIVPEHPGDRDIVVGRFLDKNRPQPK